MAEGNAPIVTFEIGLVKAKVWKNGNHYNTKFARAYKTKDGKWEDGDSFGHADLPVLERLAHRVEKFIDEAITENGAT